MTTNKTKTGTSPSNPSNNWREVLRRLEEQHGRPGETSLRPPLEQLILGILGGQTSERMARQALRRLQEEFVDFNEVRVTRPADLARTIQMVADPEEKARRIVAVLQQLFAKNSRVDLDFLTSLPIPQARGVLEQLEGIDQRTVAGVVLLSLGGNALPAEAAVVRVAKRIGLVPRGLTPGEVQQLLEETVPPGEKRNFHHLMCLHGERVCLVKTTRCADCSLPDLCQSSRLPKPVRKKSARSSRPAKSAVPGRKSPRKGSTGATRAAGTTRGSTSRRSARASRPSRTERKRKHPPSRTKRKR